MLRNSRRGSTTVLLSIVLAAMIALVMMFIELAAVMCSSSYSASVLNLAGRSVLSEFDERLKEEYNLVAFYGQASEMEDKIASYADYSLDNNRYMKVSDIDVDLKELSLENVDVLREEITEDKSVVLEKERPCGKVAASDRVLRSSKVILRLPSNGIDLNTPGIKSMADKIKDKGDDDNLIRKGTKAALAGEYVLAYFRTCAHPDDDEHFFKGEVEYILEGQMSDAKNLDKVRIDLIELRTILNSAYLWTNEVAKAEALAAAELMTPGPEGVATQALLIEAWAAAEAENDVRILFEGGRMPVFKTKDSWMLDLGSVLNPVENTLKGPEEGLTYDDYLKLLLYFLDDQSKYTRIMDVIQINMQGTYWDEFDISQMYTGFSFTAEINGREFEFNEVY